MRHADHRSIVKCASFYHGRRGSSTGTSSRFSPVFPTAEQACKRICASSLMFPRQQPRTPLLYPGFLAKPDTETSFAAGRDGLPPAMSLYIYPSSIFHICTSTYCHVAFIAHRMTQRNRRISRKHVIRFTPIRAIRSHRTANRRIPPRIGHRRRRSAALILCTAGKSCPSRPDASRP